MDYRVVLSPSRIAGAFVVLAGMATACLALYVPFAPLVKALITLWTGLTMLGACRRVAASRELVVHGDEIGIRDDVSSRHGRLADGSFVAPWLTIVRWRPAGARFDRTLLVLPDMLDSESFRRLRILLRWT